MSRGSLQILPTWSVCWLFFSQVNCPDLQERIAKTLPQICLKSVLQAGKANFKAKIVRIFCKKQEKSPKNVFSQKGEGKKRCYMFSKTSGNLSKKSKHEGKNYYHDMIIYFHALIIYFHVKIIYFHGVKKVFSLSSCFFGEGISRDVERKKFFGEGKIKDAEGKRRYVFCISAEAGSRPLADTPRWCFSYMARVIPLCRARRALGWQRGGQGLPLRARG